MANRDPHKWLGLLKWSLQYQDGTQDHELEPMSEEKKAWLKRFFEEQSYDESARMRDIVEALVIFSKKEDFLDGDRSSIENLVEELVDIISQIDQAVNLQLSGRFDTVVSLLRSRHPYIRECAAKIIATAMQNNEKLKPQAMLVLPLLTHLTVFDESPDVRRMSLLAISCVIRGNFPAECSFMDDGNGLFVLYRALFDMSDSRLQKRSLFLLMHLVVAHADIGRKLFHDGILAELLKNIRENSFDADIDLSEGVIQFLISLTNVSAENVQYLASAQGLDSLQVRLSHLRNIPNNGDCAEIDLLHSVIHRLSTTPPVPISHKEVISSDQLGSSMNIHLPNPTATQSNNSTSGTKRLFVPTLEWQEVSDDQAIPHGLHVRMDMTTGKKYAKILVPDGKEDHRSIVLVDPPEASR